MSAHPVTTPADITALVAMLRHIQCEPASFDTYSMASAAERAADAIERLTLSATTAADISPDAVEQWAQALEQELDPVVAGILRALRSALTASEKRQDEAARLLRAVGAGGIFTLMAESSDDADVWYDQRDQFLEGK